ncbi:helix-turn-helix transcriptional regulator [Pelagibacterium xiamenense]|uniref:helix-turn-helix transcriptional regulator n=1 Tax=Pelagibacterium xiamenense TaxID=2901140 RepID=UPI001E4297B4|nr:helix-turn-helix transcriptional regulator [Pelagibacterium xiamenense]MCD7059645.1 helix-turn-helix transcriptional regulator [Pelagibacterium xiamenense]
MLELADSANVLAQIEHIYDAALEGVLFETVLDTVAQSFNGAVVLLYGQDTVRQNCNFLMHRGLNSDALRSYMTGFVQRNSWFERQWAQMPGRIYQDYELLDRETFVNSRFYKDWLSWQGPYEGATGMVLFRSGTQQLVLEVRYPEHKADSLRQEATRVLERLAPHMVRAARIFHFRQHHPMENQFINNILQLLPFPIVLVERDGRVQSMNSRADVLARKMEAVFLSADGYLYAVDPADDVKLRSRISELGQACRQSSEIVVLKKHDNSGHYFVSIMTLGPAIDTAGSPGYEHYGTAGRRLALIIQDSAEALRLTHDALWRIFGLTSAEAELASSLLSGRTIGEYAIEREISKQTLRNQLASIMRKTDTSRQSQLVALLTRLAVSAVN